jgi:hypothetical protein
LAENCEPEKVWIVIGAEPSIGAGVSKSTESIGRAGAGEHRPKSDRTSG